MDNAIKVALAVRLTRAGINWAELARRLRLTRYTVSCHVNGPEVPESFFDRACAVLGADPDVVRSEAVAEYNLAIAEGREMLPPVIVGKKRLQ